MDNKTIEQAAVFKALSDPNRLMIVDMLSCGELCACKILEKFNITQPTLSHHMKTLCECGLVVARKEGKWSYYSLDNETLRAASMALCLASGGKAGSRNANMGCCDE